MSATDRTVTIVLKNGQTYRDVPLSKFSKEDQEHIQQWRKKFEENQQRLSSDIRLTIEVSKKRNEDLNSYGDPDDKEVEYEPKIGIVNHELTRSFKDVSCTLILIGENAVTGKNMKILYKENFKVTLPANDEISIIGKPFINRYDDNPSNGHAYGFKYEGFVLTLKNDKGNITHVKCTKSGWEKNVRRILVADISKTYDRNFDKESLY